MSDRKQWVCIKNSYSPWEKVCRQIPQGSVLCPALFVIYINYLPSVIQDANLVLFADDAKLASALELPNAQQRFQSQIDKMTNWANIWQLKLNIDKCRILHLGYSNPELTYYMNSNSNRIPFV